MKITFVAPYPNLAGGNRVVADYAEGLRRKGHDVVFAAAASSRSVRRQVRSAIRERKLPSRENNAAIKSHFQNRDIEIIFAEKPGPVLAETVPDADIIIATWWETAFWIKDFPAEKGEKFYFMQDYGASNQPLDRLIESWHFGYKMITISRWLDSLVQKFAPQPTALVINGVDPALFDVGARQKATPPTVGFLYSSLPTKGAAFAIDAIGKAASQIPDLAVQILGELPEEFLRQLPSNTTVRHHVRDDALRDIYGACDAWLFPSLHEGFGLPILEAMACGTPVIAFASSAAPEVMGDNVGVLTPIGDVDRMADAIVRFANMPESDWRDHAEAARNTVYPFYTVDRAVEDFEAALLNFPETR
ncbi:MAG: glycosyltransferase family 4 protein [Pseudomonadota bacterium]